MLARPARSAQWRGTFSLASNKHAAEPQLFTLRNCLQFSGDDGRWPLDGLHLDHTARLAFDVETGVGEASRWNTLRAMRVLDWARG